LRIPILYLALLSLLGTDVYAQKEYTLDLSEIEKKPLQFGGYLEFQPVLFGLDRESHFYKFRFYNVEAGKTIAEYNFRALLETSFEKGIFKAKVRTNTAVTNSISGWSHNTSLYEAFLSVKPSLSFNLDIGKKRLKWGKGYAWNPVAFIDRPKNPNDPELALEGFVVISMDYIKSFKGKLRTITFTPVLLPVTKHLNSGFGEQKKLNFGGKVYFLLYDTDIDIMFLSGGSVPARFGIDFSRNITTNIEIHGEWACIPEYRKKVFDQNGNVREKKYSSTSFLLGARILTATNTTFFLEYLKNGRGFSTGEMEDYYSLIEQAYQSYLLSGDDSRLKFLADAADQTYRSFAPFKDYLYIRISQKEPWNILYFYPSITSIINLRDKSFSLATELLYNPITNLELRAKMTVLLGKRSTDFGEKQNDIRLELRCRYYF
jgi:hypothetical protein